MTRFSERLDVGLLWVLLLLFSTFLLALWGPPLFDLDEGAFTAATSEMLRRGDYITTWLNGEPRFDKPILIYWLQSISVGIGGRDEFFFRLPSALAACAWGLSLYFFARERLGESKAQLSVLFFCSCLTIIVIGRAATADALLNLFIALTMLDAWRFVESRQNVAIHRAYLWIGLGLLTKGPVAAVVPFVTLSLYSFAKRDWVLWKAVAMRPMGWLIVLAVATPWYVMEYLAQGDAFVQGFLIEHNLGRFSSTMESHGGSLLYYLPVLLLMFLPFTAWFVVAVANWKQVRTDSLLLWCWIWFAFVVVFFSVSGTQLPHYILYGSTPMFLIMANHSERLRSSWWVAIPAAMLIVVWLCIPGLMTYLGQDETDPYLVSLLDRVSEVITPQYFWFLAGALLVTLALPFTPLQRLRQFQVLGLVHILALVLIVIPLVAEIKQAPVKNAAIFARGLEEPILMWRHDMPSFSTYLNETTPKLTPQPGNLVFTREGKLPNEGLDVLFSEGGILVGRVTGSVDL